MPMAANIVRQWNIWLGATGLEVKDLNMLILAAVLTNHDNLNNVVKCGYFIPAGGTTNQYSDISILIVDVNAH